MVTFQEGVAKHLIQPTSLDPFLEGCALTDVNHSSNELAEVCDPKEPLFLHGAIKRLLLQPYHKRVEKNLVRWLGWESVDWTVFADSRLDSPTGGEGQILYHG